MKSNIERMLTIAYDTYNHYVTEGNPRGICTGKCQYMTPSGAMCAVGRQVENPQHLEDISPSSSFHNILIEANWKQGSENLPVDFWAALQRFHDKEAFWGQGGKLTAYGEDYFQLLIEGIKSEVFK